MNHTFLFMFLTSHRMLGVAFARLQTRGEAGSMLHRTPIPLPCRGFRNVWEWVTSLNGERQLAERKQDSACRFNLQPLISCQG